MDCGRDLREGLAEHEADGCGEQRGASELERLDTRGARPQAFLPRPQALFARGFTLGFGSGYTRFVLPQQANRLSHTTVSRREGVWTALSCCAELLLTVRMLLNGVVLGVPVQKLVIELDFRI
jgi:hypothetical protein